MARNTQGLKRGGSPGRPKGRQNNATLAAKALCAAIVTDPAYIKGLRQRALKGKLAPAVECLIWHYAHGKPAESMNIQWSDDQRIERLHRGRERATNFKTAAGAAPPQ